MYSKLREVFLFVIFLVIIGEYLRPTTVSLYVLKFVKNNRRDLHFSSDIYILKEKEKKNRVTRKRGNFVLKAFNV